MPKRIQRKRTRGWKMPPDTVYVGRPTKWGNEFLVRDCISAEYCVGLFQRKLAKLNTDSHGEIYKIIRHFLRGKDLACWCALDQPCHADVLLEIANAEAA